MRDSRMYLAAFIAIWLCSFVIVGGGQYIRSGVLVMASWIAIGRKISLAPPALSSLYFYLRAISRHPVGPTFCKQPWAIHYIIGWMYLYLKNTFGPKVKGTIYPLLGSCLCNQPCYKQCVGLQLNLRLRWLMNTLRMFKKSLGALIPRVTYRE